MRLALKELIKRDMILVRIITKLPDYEMKLPNLMYIRLHSKQVHP